MKAATRRDTLLREAIRRPRNDLSTTRRSPRTRRRFYAARGFQKIAHVYLHDARYCYLAGVPTQGPGNSIVNPHSGRGANPGPTSTIGRRSKTWTSRLLSKSRKRVGRNRPGNIDRQAYANRARARERSAALIVRTVVRRGSSESHDNGDNIIVRPAKRVSPRQIFLTPSSTTS